MLGVLESVRGGGRAEALITGERQPWRSPKP